MIDPQELKRLFTRQGVNFFVGVPDSLMQGLCSSFEIEAEYETHILAANEGAAVAIAVGHFLGSGDVPLVYMQNSGLGNAINPLASLAAKEVYSIPLVLLIGWRGSPGAADEPQHQLQGQATPLLLEALGIPWISLGSNLEDAREALSSALWEAKHSNSPAAILVEPNSIAPLGVGQFNPGTDEALLVRQEAIEIVASVIGDSRCVIGTTGKISRELFSFRKSLRQSHDGDFLTIGSMGHSSQIALGLASARPDLDVVCLDGDGSVLMHMGGMATIGNSNKNFFHIVLNNGMHESVGGQRTMAGRTSFTSLASSCGYTSVARAASESDLRVALEDNLAKSGTRFLEIPVLSGSNPSLARPDLAPVESKRLFMDYVDRARPRSSLNQD